MSPEPHLLDSLEAAAWKDLAESMPAQTRRRAELQVLHVGPAVVLRAPGLDHLLLNRTLGLAGHRISEAVLDRVLAAYRERGIDRFFVHVHEQDAEGPLGHAVEARGLVPYRRRWAKYARGDAPCPEGRTDLGVAPARAAHAAELGRIFTDAFDMPPEAGGMVGGVIGRRGWHLFEATDRGEPVAVAALYVDGPLGYLAFAATRPSHRGRGAQSALMAHRVRTALGLGCRQLFTETGEEVPGEPNPSGNNMLRNGFRIVSMRRNYAPPGTAWVREDGHGAG